MSVEFPPLEFAPAYRKVAAALLERISDRSLNAGDRLPPEVELARQFGVNRSTVREALRELESTGVLRRQRGSKLMMVSRPERAAVADGVSRALALHDVSIRDVWEGLTILEPPIAEAAARHRRAADLALIDGTVAQAMQSEAVAAGRQAADFFRHLGEASHNRVLMLAHEPLLQLLAPSLRTIIDEVAAARARIATAQRKIAEAVRAGDAAAARGWCEKHIRDYRRGFDLAGIDLASRVQP
jgi:GntR family transcriptional regulator, transcriptional repressor for pyruvate dehydrogenase complex